MSYADYDIPGVYARILDQTQFQAESVPMVLGMVSSATKGAFNTPTEVVSLPDWFNKFGGPNPDSQGYYAADAYFARGNKMWFIRVGDGSEAKAYIDLTTVGGSSPRIRANAEGTWGHDIDVYVTQGSAGGATIKIEIYYLGALVYTYDNVSNASDVDLATLLTDNLYVEAVNGAAGGTISQPQAGTLTGGDDGTTALTAANINGTTSGITRTGMEMFKSKREYPIDVLIAPDGAAIANVGDSLLSIAEERGDCYAILDTPDSLTPAQAVTWIDTGGTGGKWDSSWGGCYYPWVSIRDDKNVQDVWTPPSGHIAGVMAYNDDVAWPWFAAAFVKRGRLIKALNTRTPLEDNEIRTLYTNSRINTLVRRNGIIVNGKKSLLDNTTALRWSEVRRGLIALRGLAESAIRNSVQFNPNDDVTFRELEAAMQPVVEFLIRERAFRELVFECKASNNPARTKRQHQIKGRFYCKPTIGIEVIILDIVLTAEGLSFSEQTVQAA